MSRLKDIRVWLRGLVAAIIGGAANAVTTVIVAPETFNFQTGKSKLLAVATASAIVNAAMYLKQSPVPPELPEDKKE
jgi:hypothetical protein